MPTLSPDLAKLVAERIDSFEKLEMIVLLYKTATRSSSARDLARDLGLERSDARQFADEMASAGLVKVSSAGDVVLEPKAGEMRLLDELAQVYDEDKILLVQAIAEASMKRLRNMAGRAFADAFIIGKPRGDDDDR